MKQKSIFICQSCGNDTPKWAGKCPFCNEWNSLVERTIAVNKLKSKSQKTKTGSTAPQKLSQIKQATFTRIKTGIDELDRVLGGGLVPGSVILLAGEPGIGKSTLVLQLTAALSKNATLYISGEESLEQIKIRADRLKIKTSQALFLSETDVDTICVQIKDLKPKIAIIDSIQTLATDDLSSPAGSVGQVKESTARLIRVAKITMRVRPSKGQTLNVKSAKTAIILIGHVTKEGIIAGPKVLEHMVDAVITLEGEKFANFRLLRTTKNRFGATSEVGIFEMTDLGMREVKNPSQALIKDRVKRTPGSIIVPTIEGTRPILAEIQALVVPTQLPIPRRVAQGIDYNRLQLIIAILTKRLNLKLFNQDIIVNVTGGIKIEDPGADLGVALAIYSSAKNIALSSKTAVFGELGLLGELRPVYQETQRAKEAKRLGFTKIISPQKFSSIREVIKKLSPR